MPRYSGRVTFKWEFSSDLPQEEAQREADKMWKSLDLPPPMANAIIVLEAVKQKIDRITLGEFSPQNLFDHLTETVRTKNYTANDVTYSVKINSARYFLFKQQPYCVACGLQGTRLLLECNPGDRIPHFNLYGEENGELVMLNKDHIRAKSVGGKDSLDNYQTMCIICNNLKAHYNLTAEKVKQLRDLYNSKKDMPKKKLRELLEAERNRLNTPWPKSTPIYKNSQSSVISDAVLVLEDLYIYNIDKELIAVAKEIPDKSLIGSIKKDCILESLVFYKGRFMCKWDHDVVMISQFLVKEQ